MSRSGQTLHSSARNSDACPPPEAHLGPRDGQVNNGDRPAAAVLSKTGGQLGPPRRRRKGSAGRPAGPGRAGTASAARARPVPARPRRRQNLRRTYTLYIHLHTAQHGHYICTPPPMLSPALPGSGGVSRLAGQSQRARARVAHITAVTYCLLN